MSDSCNFRCKHCHQQFSEKAVYQESAVLLCPHCTKTFIPNFWFYLRKEWIEPLSVAIVLALFIKRILFEIYVIPTSSMEPTLHGGGHYPEDGGDKVLVNKFIYSLAEPQNWDVIVFEPPHENHLFIKRLIGLPGQKIQIVNGDIYVNGKINRRTPEVENAMLYPVYDSREKSNHLAHFKDFNVSPWNYDDSWKLSENFFSITGGQKSSLKFNLPIDMRIESHKANKMQKDSGLFEYTNRIRQWNEHSEVSYLNLKVGDIKIKAQIKVKKGQGILSILVSKNAVISKLILDFANKKGESYLNDEKKREFKFEYELNDYFPIEFNNIDDKLAGVVNLSSFVYNYENKKPDIQTYLNGLEIITENCDLDMKDIVLLRDINYLYTVPDYAYCSGGFGAKERIEGSESNNEYPTYLCGEDEILCFGDNVLDSSDSRIWGFAKKSSIKGQASFVIMPIRIWPGNDLPPQIPFLTYRTRVFRIH